MAEPITVDTLGNVRETSKAFETVKKNAEGAARAVGKAADSSRKASYALSDVEKASRKAGSGLDGIRVSGNQANIVLDNIRNSSRRTRKGLDDVRTSGSQTRRALKELAKEKATILLEARDQLTPVLEGAGSGLRGLTGKSWSVSVGLIDNVTGPVKELSGLLGSLQSVMAGAEGMLGEITVSLNVTAGQEEKGPDFSSIFDDAEKIAAIMEALGVTGTSLIKASAVAGGILAAVGLGAAAMDLKQAHDTNLTWDRDRYLRRGLTKTGLVAGGAAAGVAASAAAGAAMGSVVPVAGTVAGALIGAGIGGLTAVYGGDSISEMFKTEREKTHESLLHMGDDLKEAVADFQESASRTDLTRSLIGEYETLRDTLNSPGFDDTKAEEVQGRMKQILGELKDTFPELYTKYDTLNGLSNERLDLIKKEMDKEDEQARRHLKQSVMNTEAKLPQMIEDYGEVNSSIEKNQNEWERTSQYKDGLDSLLMDYHKAMEGNLRDIPQEDREAALNNLIHGANALADQYGFKADMQTYGSVEGKSKSQGKKAKGLSDTIDKELDEKAGLDEQLKTYYAQKLQLIEMETGVDLEDNKGKTAALEEVYKALKSNDSISEEMGLTAEQILPGFSEAGDVKEQLDFLSKGIQALKDEAEPAWLQIEALDDALRGLPKDTQFTIGIQVKESENPFVNKVLSLVNQDTILSAVSHRPEPGQHARGGFVNSRELSWIGEDGPEAVIPLSGKYRKRGLELYEQAGHYLGMGSDADRENDTGVFAAPAAVSGGASASAWGQGAVIQITASPQTQVQIGPQSSMEEIMSVLRQSWSGVTDRMLGEIAGKIRLSFENMAGGAV